MSNLSQKKGYKSHLVKKAAVALTVFTMASAGVVAIDSAHSEDAYAATALKKTAVKKFGNLKKGYTVYTGITLTKKAGTTDAHTAKTLYVQYSFQKNGKTYYRVLQNKKHFGVVEAAAFKQAGNGLNYFGAKNVISNRQVQITAKDSIYSNLNSLKVAGSTEDHIGEMTVSNGYFNHYNGQRYYALYQDGKLFGYVNTKALKANATDLTALNAAIKAADELKAEDYTKASFEAFAKVLDEAKATAKKVGVNKADADAAVKALDDATKALVKELRVESVSAINAKSLKVTFNTAVDTTKAVFEVKKGTVKVNTSNFAWNEAKTEVTIELAGKITKGDYTVNVTGLSDETLTGTVATEDEKVAKIEILSNEAPLVDAPAAIENAVPGGTDDPDVDDLLVGYRVLNQYGEDITKTTTLTTSSPNVVLNPSTGSVYIVGDFDTNINKLATFTLIHTSTATTATATVTAVSEAKISNVSVVGLYNKDGKAITETTNLTNDMFYVELDVKDQYGNVVNDSTKVNNELLVTESNPLVVDAAANASVITVDGKKKVVVALSGTPTVGSNIITVISKATGKSASYTVTVDESVRAYNVDIQAPELALRGETVNLPVVVTDKEGNLITDLTILKNPTRGIKVTQGTSDVTNNLIVKDGAVVLPATLTAAYESFVVISNATQKVDTLTLETKAVAVPTTVTGLKSTFSTTLKAGATPTITTANLEVEDQYGRVMTQTQVEAWLDLAGTNEIEISSDSTNAVITSAAGSVKKSGGSYDAVTVNAGSINGTEVITIALKDAAGVITSSTKDVTLRVTDGSEYVSYSVDEIGTVYDEAANSKTDNAAYDKKVNVYGLLSDGSKVKLAPGEYNVTSKNAAVAADITANGILNVATSPTGLSYTDAEGNAVDTVKVPVSITINATGETFNQEVTFSKVAPKVTEVAVVANGKGSDLVTGKTVPNFTSGNFAPSAVFDFASTYGTFADVVVTDQYGAKVVISGADAFADGTTIAAPTVTFSKVAGKTVFGDNGLTSAKVTEMPLNSAFKFVLDFAGTKSDAIEVKVTQAYSATAAADMLQANNDITTDLAAAIAGITTVATPGTTTQLVLGTATNGSTITWSSNNTAILTNGGLGVNDGAGGTAVFTVKVNKTVNGQVGTEQTKAYDVVVNNDGTLQSVTAK